MIKEPRGPKGPTRKMRNRLFICVMPIVFLLFSVVLANVGYIAVVNNDFYQNKATQQQLRDVTVNGKSWNDLRLQHERACPKRNCMDGVYLPCGY